MHRHTFTLTMMFILGVHIFLPTEASAQLINLKTAPVATGDQFMVQPPVNAGMGGLSIAFDDTLGDALVNPAKTARLNGMQVYMNPTFYRITDGNGMAKTLSVGGLASGNRWFGGLGVAIQDMDRPHAGTNRLKDQSTNNNYLWLQGGRLLNEATSLGGRLFWAGLGASEGVDMLYPRSDRINQDGYMLDIRLGLDGKTGSRGRYEILTLFARTDMTHEVIYQNSCAIQPGLCNPAALTVQEPSSSVEKNMDKTNTWGLHLGYDQPVEESNWRWGSILTLNVKTHPKIPNYELMNIPRDPGNTWALNAGMGASNTSGDNVTFGAEFVIEPVWSNTGVEAQEDIWDEEETELLVEKGDKTIENEFAFVNSLVKTGLGWRGKHVLLESGIMAKTYRYQLKQTDYVEDSFRDQEENWTEWRFSLSAGLIFESVELKYTGLLTTGTGQPGTASTGAVAEASLGFSATGGDFVFAPDGELALEDARVFTHQVTVTIPL
ncbi:hypothetical protein SAMN05443144_12055 [Fodinibius roseus]|uniref:Long-chain fatty acid transport protein n=1 Tax=Fodinibius roseus TaxID=1194090 RepID=A0A1M5HIW9_9BACT|nr:hypothetical protein [Fodinibius roseus]SHG15841.1 hypothetical protein SAMN05443144_12055 [Fodinibius roseus]